MNPFQLISQYFWLICLVMSLVNYLIARRRLRAATSNTQQSVQPGAPTVTEAIDLIVANKHARAIAACVPQCHAGDIAPSDHWPVQAIYQLA